ncbi:MAG: AmmeMemoRadiSam system protein B [Myxococcota bacterium]
MNIVRPPAVAGSFYSADPRTLETTVNQYLEEVPARAEGARPKALIVPHAGYRYSGPVAASAFASLRPLRPAVERVVLLGPSHHAPLRGLAATEALAFATPLGRVDVDQDTLQRALALPQVHVLESAHALEHSLEVQLPFLQQVLGTFLLVPLTVGDASDGEVAEVIDALWGGDETLIVVSSDLSHHYDYDTARRLDAATSGAIEALAPDRLGDESACGRVPVRGLLVAAKRHGLACKNVDLRNSGDTSGPRSQVVGYGAYVLR